MSFWSRISPRRGVEDFVSEWRRPQPYRWRALGLAVAATFALMMMLIPENQRAEPARPDVTYITSWRADRTDEEITASNIENQRRQDELAALQERRAELRKKLYRELGRATGLDVEQMERDIARQAAAEQAAARAQETPPREPVQGE
jgi:Skp family chaperone for outer membrane proteins